jgi:hypothetical protein
MWSIMSDSSGHSGFRRFLVWCFWIFAIVLVGGVVIGLIARAIFVHYTDRAWAEAVAQVDALDPDWRWEQIEEKRTKIPDEENSALVIVRLRDSGRLKEQNSSGPAFDCQPDPQSPAIDRAEAVPLPMPDEAFERAAQDMVADLPPEVRLDPVLARALTRELAKGRDGIAEAMKLADMPNGRHPLNMTPDFISTMLPTIQYSRTVASTLGAEAARRAEAGDLPGALRAVRACLNVARSTGDEPIMITMLVRIAIDTVAVNRLERILAQGQLSDAELAAMKTALETEAATPRLVQALRGERAGTMKLCEAVIRGDVDAAKLTGSQASGVENSMASATSELLARQARPQMLRLYTDMIEAVRRPTPDWEDGLNAVEAQIKNGAILTRMLMPAVIKVTQADLRCQATLRSAATAVAAERFRLARSRWPKDLDEMVAGGFLKELPADPYTGEPLRIARKLYGLVIYSVGPDRVDDGGAPFKYAAKPTGDIPFRLFDPKLRRSLAEPLPMPRELAE